MPLPSFLKFSSSTRRRQGSSRDTAGNSVYPALSKDQIRLLTITSNKRGKLVTELKSVDWHSHPEFYALSYTWGSSSDTETILCNGRALEIRANLHEALQTLYSPPVQLTRPIWIDAICINQQDDEEKGPQVRRMGDIFREAHLVVVWLGPSENNSDLAMDRMEWLAERLPLVVHPPLDNKLPDHGLPKQEDPLWLALGHLYRRKWFCRLWTFQEVVLATDVTIVCGQKTIALECLETIGEAVNRLGLHQLCFDYEEISTSEDGFLAMHNVKSARGNLRSKGNLSFPYLLQVGDDKLVTDARDRVYGMLALTLERFRNRIPISYASPAIQIYIDCAKACIEEENEFMLLELIAGRLRQPGLPSWCPDLNSTQGTIEAFGDHLRAGFIEDSQESTTSKAATKVSLSNVLSITGFRADTVAEVVDETLHWSTVSDEQQIARSRKFLDWEAHCLDLAQRTYRSPPGVVPLGHLFNLTGNNREKIPKEKESAFLQAYFDNLANNESIVQDGDAIWPPLDRLALFHGIWEQIYSVCQGRRYFSTEGGHLGIGPPDIEKGDIVCVFYGARPVFVLRPAVKDGSDGWLLQGNAFLHGFMELSETPTNERGVDEVFNIF